MERYNLDKKIHSCSVDKGLIFQIEKYLTNRLSKKMVGILSLDDTPNIDYQISFKDSLGEEHLSSISDYHRNIFPNDIEEIVLSYSINHRSVDIRVRFSKEYIFSNVRIDLRCEGAKEVALGISDEINNLVKDNKTIHYIFYNKFAITIYGLWILNAYAWNENNFNHSGQLSLFFFLLGAAYFLLRQVSPYSSFETNNSNKREKFISWILNGLAGVFFFGVIAIYLRDILF